MKTLTDEEFLILTAQADFQKARKPVWMDGGGVACQRCGCVLEESDIFCPDCGQKIDWSEEEDAEQESN